MALLVRDDLEVRVPLLVQGGVRPPENGEIDPAQFHRPKLRTNVVPQHTLGPDRRYQLRRWENAVSLAVNRKVRNPAGQPLKDLIGNPDGPFTLWCFRRFVTALVPRPLDLDSVLLDVAAPQPEDLGLAHARKHDEAEAQSLPLTE